MVLIVLFAVPGLILPLIIGVYLAARYRRNPLGIAVASFVMKPLIATPFGAFLATTFAMMPESVFGKPLLLLLFDYSLAIGGLTITVAMVVWLRDLLRAHPAVAAALLIGDAARWISAGFALSGYDLNDSFRLVLPTAYPIALIIPNLYALAALVYTHRVLRRDGP